MLQDGELQALAVCSILQNLSLYMFNLYVYCDGDKFFGYNVNLHQDTQNHLNLYYLGILDCSVPVESLKKF